MGVFDSPIEIIHDQPSLGALVVLAGDGVHYFPGVHDILNRDRRNDPLAATVSRVNPDDSVNLLVVDVRRGITLERNQVRLAPMDPLIEGYFTIRAPSAERLSERIESLDDRVEALEASTP